MACYLAASLRNNLPPEVELIGYCPEHRYAELPDHVIETLRRMNCEVRTFDAIDKFNPEYPHGNKILAAQEKRGTQYSAFMDSDILMLDRVDLSDWIKSGHVSASPAASMLWAPQTIWTELYTAFDMEVPTERIMLMRDKRSAKIPYYSSGFIVFPEKATNGGLRFPDVWMDTALTIDRHTSVEKKRPYLDQLSLPIAIKRAGLNWNELPEEHHFILGGKLRGKAFPSDRDIKLVHYRAWLVLEENGLTRNGYRGLARQIGTRRVSNVFKYDENTKKLIR
ncbi:MAG: hypothetical protein AAF826_10850 [Pseudomonadota bacterium]